MNTLIQDINEHFQNMGYGSTKVSKCSDYQTLNYPADSDLLMKGYFVFVDDLSENPVFRKHFPEQKEYNNFFTFTKGLSIDGVLLYSS